MARDPRMLQRIHRVRTLQLTLAHGEEARAREQVATETALGQRIAALVQAVAPSPAALSGVALGAAAHYRERLTHSADAAQMRVTRAEAEADRAAARTRTAKQDQGAVEKLLDRARLAALATERRALEDLPAASGNRHDPC